MLKVGILGIGNAGNQVVAEAYAYDKTMSVFAINSSDQDLETLGDAIPKIVIGEGKGAGKNRDDSKRYLTKELEAVIMKDEMKNFLLSIDILFVVSSCGGGTGSGISLLLSQILRKIYPSVFPIPVGILPVLKEALSAQANTLEYLDELYEKMGTPTYMLYDNEKYANRSTNKMMDDVNKRIVHDIVVLSGYYNHVTKYASIDNKDMLNLDKTPGRIVVLSLPEFKEKDLDNTTVEQLLMSSMTENPHVNLQKDRIVNRIGIIANINQYIAGMFDTTGSGLESSIGHPVENFEHLCINDDRKMPNYVYVVLTGLTKINDRIRRINDRIDEINSARQEIEEEDDALHEFSGTELNSQRSYDKGEVVQKESIDLRGILEAFNVTVEE